MMSQPAVANDVAPAELIDDDFRGCENLLYESFKLLRKLNGLKA